MGRVNSGNGDFFANSCAFRAIHKTTEGILILFSVLSNDLVYRTSSDDGETWSSANVAYTGTDVYDFDTYMDANNDIHVVISFNGGSQGFPYFTMTFQSGITWSIGSVVDIASSRWVERPVITQRSNGELWAVIARDSDFKDIWIYNSDDAGATWNFKQRIGGTNYCARIMPYGVNLMMITQRSSGLLSYHIYNGSTFSIADIATGITNDTRVGAVKISDSEIYASCATPSGIKVFKWNGSSWDGGTLLSSHVIDRDPALSNFNGKPACVWSDYNGGAYDIAYRLWNGSSWDSAVNVTSDTSSDWRPTAIDSDSDAFYFAWENFGGTDFIYFFKYVPIPTFEGEDTITLSDEVYIKPSKEFLYLADSLGLSDDIELDVSLEKIYLNDTLNITDEVSFAHEIDLSDTLNLSILEEAKLTIERLYLADGLNLSDDIQFNISKEKIYLNDTLNLIESKVTKVPAFASKVVYGNSPYLIVVTDDSPASIIKVDISGASPVWQIQNIDGTGVFLENAQDVAVNTTFETIHVAGADGKIAVIDLNDLTDMTEIDLVDTDDLTTIEVINDLKITLAGTENTIAELYKLDNRDTAEINTDFRFLRDFVKIFKNLFDWTFGKLFNTDFRFLAINNNKVNTDFRFLVDDYNSLEPIPRYGSGFNVKIDDVEAPDVDLASIVIRHNVDDISTAEFTLGRNYDRLDYTVDGVYSQITNQNNIKIYVEGVLQFEGKITNLLTNAQNERITVLAKSENEWDKLIITKNLPIASLNERHHLYHALVRNVNIEHLDPDTEVITVTGLSCEAGKKVLTGSGFTEDVEGETIDIIGGTNFIEGAYIITKYIDSSTVALEEIPTEKDTTSTKVFQGNYYYLTYHTKNASGAIGYINLNPIVYRGIKVDLGDSEQERVIVRGMFYTPTELAELIEDGEWTPFQNWTYFWRTSGEDFVNNRTWNRWYIGTSLAPIASDAYLINEVLYTRQRIYDNWVTDLGYYYTGTYPYKEISTKNGQYFPKFKYEDRDDGLYKTIGKGYDYDDYAKEVADLEYQKILNINDDVTPITSANVDLTLNGYLYYGVKLLTRINITNTTQSGIYTNSNGFPLSIKTIEINSKSMLATLTLDNRKSDYELKIIDNQYPEEPEETLEYSWRTSSKYDLPKWSDVE